MPIEGAIIEDSGPPSSSTTEEVDTMVEIRVNGSPVDENDITNSDNSNKKDDELQQSTASDTSTTPVLLGASQTPLTPHTPNKRLSSISNVPLTPTIQNQRYNNPEGGTIMGNTVTNNPVVLWLLCCLVPLAYLAIVFGAIPIGERRDDDDNDSSNRRFYHYWVFTCVVNPINMVVIAFLLSGTFLSCLGVDRPFRVHWSILATSFVVQIIIFNVIVPFRGTFSFFGVASLFLGYVTTFSATYFYETWKVKRQCAPTDLKAELTVLHKNFWQFVKVAICFFIFFLVLILYMWAYQHVGSGIGQKLLPFGMTIGVFIVRKVMLALTDFFPLNVAMLISGFWIENIYDMFQTMAYRNVKLPVNYVTIWFTNALSLLANLVFLTDTWFMFRIWIKAYLPLMFSGKCCPYKLGIEPDDSEDDNERGHSNNKIGYHRRQARFFMYKVFSKVIAAVFYLLIGTILRYGMNRKLFPFDDDSHDEYTNSLQFSVYNLVFLICAGIAAAIFVRLRHRALYDHFVGTRHTLTNRHMLGNIISLLIHNGIVAISMMMYFNRIFYVVDDRADD